MLMGQPSVNLATGQSQWRTTTNIPFRTPFEQGVRPQSSLDILSNPTSMLHVNTRGFGMPGSANTIPTLSSPRPILGCNWQIPHANSSLCHMNSPPSSDDSAFSSVDISDLVSSLSVSPPRREREMMNLRGLHQPSSNSMWPQLDSNRPWSLRDNIRHLSKAKHFNNVQSNTSPGQPTCSYWIGELPRRFALSPTYSCKVFLGGVPWDITEETLLFLFMQFGSIRVEWPGKEDSTVQPKGYVYIIFENENQVKKLLNCCTRDSCENYYFKIYCRRLKTKLVQVIPWRLSDSNFVLKPSEQLDGKTTVFVGGLHGALTAEGLYKIMDELFGGVIYVGIDTDKYKYPIGSARVTFNNQGSYIKAVMSAFLDIKTNKFAKKVQIDPYLEDSLCSICLLRSGPYFCRELSCFRYFCFLCWGQQHQSEFLRQHRPLVRTSKYNGNSNPSPHFRYLPQ